MDIFRRMLDKITGRANKLNKKVRGILKHQDKLHIQRQLLNRGNNE